MKHLHVQISDDIHREILIFIAEEYGNKKGAKSQFAEDALTAHLRKLTRKKIADELNIDESEVV